MKNAYENAIMGKIPPEKYYEACITYNLVNEFEERFDKKIFPFSISQIEEKIEGYDFGYTFSGESFFIQYKRPFIYSTDSIYSWQICREQLKIINRNQIGLKTYYALPAFVDNMKWFEGLENTYFVLAPKLEEFFINRNNKGSKTNNINSKSNILNLWEHFMPFYANNQKNVAAVIKDREISFKDIISYANSLNLEAKQCTWFYLIKE